MAGEMGGERSLERVLAGVGSGAGCLGCLGCWWPWTPGRALLRRFGPRLGLTGPRLDRATELLKRRGWPALASGRTTPGLRTVTVVAAASSGIRAGRALPALVLGSSVFLQAHLLLGYALGPAAREVLEQARLPVLVAAALAVVAILLLVRRRTPRPGSWPRGLVPPAWPSAWSAAAPNPPGPVPSPPVGERSRSRR
jgi:membrane protein DedA with SNARE-associated domain